MGPTKRRTISASTKNAIAARQSHKCALVPGYDCPLKGTTFDESGFHIDHIVELADAGSDDPENMQAICPACHSVKTQRARVNRVASKKKTISAARRSDKPSEEEILTAVHCSSPDDISEFLIKHANWSGTVAEFLNDRGIAFDKIVEHGTLLSKLLVNDPKKLCVSLGIKKPKTRLVLHRKTFETEIFGGSFFKSSRTQEEMLRIATGDSGLNIDNFMTDYVVERRGIGGGTRFMHGELVNSCDPRDLNVYRVYDLAPVYNKLPTDIFFV